MFVRLVTNSYWWLWKNNLSIKHSNWNLTLKSTHDNQSYPRRQQDIPSILPKTTSLPNTKSRSPNTKLIQPTLFRRQIKLPENHTAVETKTKSPLGPIEHIALWWVYIQRAAAWAGHISVRAGVVRWSRARASVAMAINYLRPFPALAAPPPKIPKGAYRLLARMAPLIKSIRAPGDESRSRRAAKLFRLARAGGWFCGFQYRFTRFHVNVHFWHFCFMLKYLENDCCGMKVGL